MARLEFRRASPEPVEFVMFAFIAVSGVGLLTETYAEVMRAAGAAER